MPETKVHENPEFAIVDAHCHTSYDDPSTADRIAEAALEFGISHCVLLGDVLAFGYHPSEDQIRAINDGNARSVERRPGFFSGLCFMNPELPASFVQAEIRRCIEQLGFSGVKLEASINSRSERLDAVMESAEALGVYVLHHAFYDVRRRLDTESTPADIADLARRFPNVRIQMAHLGGVGVRGVQDLAPCPNVSVDTSGSQPIAGLIEYAVSVLGDERVVYGSDVPGRDYSAQLGRVYGAKISDASRRKILGSNTTRLLKRKEGRA